MTTINPRDKTKGFVTLNQVVASVLNKKNDYSKHGRKRLLQFAIEGYREFGLYHIPSIEAEWLPVNNDIKTVTLPDQTMEFISVGIALEGRYWEFSKLESGINPEGFNRVNPDRQEVVQRETTQLINYGFPGGENDFMYYHDKPNRRLVIYSPFDLNEVLVYYKSSGISSSGNTVIPIHAFQALRAYIQMEDVDDDPMVSMGEKQRREMKYLGHLKNMRDIENRFTVDEFLDAIRSGYGQTFKR